MFPYILLSKLNVFLILFFCSCTITPIVCWLWEINGFWIRRLRKGLGCPPLTGFVHSSSDIPEKSLFAQFLHLWFWSLFAQFCISDLSHPRSWGGSLQMMKDDEGWWRMIKDDEGWWRMMKDDEGWRRVMKDDEGWWSMMKNAEERWIWWLKTN